MVLDRDVSKVKGFAIACDVTDPKSVRAAFDKIAATYGGVDIVVSNAAPPGRARSVKSTRRSCVEASNSISGPIRAWRRTPFAS